MKKLLLLLITIINYQSLFIINHYNKLSITIINSGSMNKAQIAAGIIIIVLVIGIALLMSKPSTTSITTTLPSPSPAATGLLTFQLIDPPQVPNNTQALVITYSS